MKKVIRSKSEAVRIKEFFNNMAIGDIDLLLFTPRYTQVEEKAKQKFLSDHDDLSKLTDAEIRRTLVDCKPKSDWDRFFSSKIQINDIETKLNNIREYRNSVAHHKNFNKQDYMECNKLLDEFIKAILEAIEITEEVDFVEKNNEYFEAAYANVKKALEPFEKIRKQIERLYALPTIQDLINPPVMKAIADIANTGICKTIHDVANSPAITAAEAMANSPAITAAEAMANSPAITAAQSLANSSILKSTRDLFNASQLGYDYFADIPNLSYLNVFRTPPVLEQSTELLNSLNSSYRQLGMTSNIGLGNRGIGENKNGVIPENKEARND